LDIAHKARTILKNIGQFNQKERWTNEVTRNSCFENTRGGGGSQGYLHQHHPKDDLDHIPSRVTKDRDDFVDKDGVSWCRKEFEISASWCSASKLISMSYSPHAGVLEARARRAIDWSGVYREAMIIVSESENLHCTVWPVCEPLKVRNITKGQSEPYAIAKQQQKWVHSYLRGMKPFALIGGEPVSADLIESLRRPGCKWVSGDFSAATDKLSIRVTKLVSGVLRERMTESEWSIFSKVLYEHRLHYDPKCLGRGFSVIEDTPEDDLFKAGGHTQTNGQLMGSILSFPFLCIANAIAFWQAVHPTKTWKEVSKLVLVNGDDILFQATEEEYALWAESVKAMGFELSLGKNFFHAQYLVVNSLPMWDSVVTPCKGVRPHNEIVIEPFHNIALALGISKVQAKTGIEGKLRDMPAIYAEYIRGAYNKPRAQLRFLHYQSKEVNHYSKGGLYNLYIPKEYGGLGMTNYAKIGYMTPKQVRLAELYFEVYSSKECFLKAPVKGYTPPAQDESDLIRPDPAGMMIHSTMKQYSFDRDLVEKNDRVYHAWNSSCDVIKDVRSLVYADPVLEKRARQISDLHRIRNGGGSLRTHLVKEGEYGLVLSIPKMVEPQDETGIKSPGSEVKRSPKRVRAWGSSPNHLKRCEPTHDEKGQISDEEYFAEWDAMYGREYNPDADHHYER